MRQLVVYPNAVVLDTNILLKHPLLVQKLLRNSRFRVLVPLLGEDPRNFTGTLVIMLGLTAVTSLPP